MAYLGEEITEEEEKERGKKGLADHVMEIGGRRVDGRTHICGGQYMNTRMAWELDGGRKNNVKMMGAPYGTLRVSCEGGVREGEQLWLDYGVEYWRSRERQRVLEGIWRGTQQGPG